MTSAPSCDHCGLPLPTEPVRDDTGHAFCCAGCATVFGVLNAEGLGDFYRLRGDEPGAKASVSGRGFDEFDDPAFFALYGRVLESDPGLGDGPLAPGVPAGTTRASINLYVEGVHCSACIWLVERLPTFVSGVRAAELDFGRRVARIVFDPRAVRLSEIARALDRLGYPPHPVRGHGAREARQAEERRELVRLGVAAALGMNAMLIAFALYGGIMDGMEPAMRTFLRTGSLLLALLAVLWPGRTFLRGGLVALRTRTAHMDLPVAIGLVAGIAGGTYNTVTGQGEVYFESVALLVFFLLVGRYLQSRQQRVAQDSLELMHALTPSRARRIDPATGEVRDVPAAALGLGDRLELLPGDLVPADGTLVGAEGVLSTVDMALLTGESRPVEVRVDDSVFAGCTNLGRRVELVVTALGTETRLGSLMGLVEEATTRAAPSLRFADRMAGRFTWSLIAMAALTLALWWPRDPAAAVENAVALLIVACPCALGLATPLAIVAAVGKAARRGILVQGGAALERLGRAGTIFLDKTGTLTRGELAVEEAHGDPAEWPWIAALEAHSNHPLAAALRRHVASAVEAGEEPRGAIEGAEEVLGRGLAGVFQGAPVLVGSTTFLAERGVELEGAQCDGTELGSLDLAAMIAAGRTPVLAARGGRLVAAFGVGNPLFEDARSQTDALRARGWRVGILSGDHPAIVARAGAELGLEPGDVHGGVTPEAKLAAVEAALDAARRVDPDDPAPVVMVGDGVNDAAALAAATVGVAVCGGAEASLAAADVYMSRPGLGHLTALVDGAVRTRGVIRRGLSVSLVYNTAAAALAMAGVINPIWAAILMPVSSLTVVSLAYRSRTFDPDQRAG